MLRAIGFEYAGRIDPFDGGPHFSARTDDIVLVRDAKRATAFAAEPPETAPNGIVSVERDGDPHFVAVMSRYVVEGERVGIPEATRRALGVNEGDTVGFVAVA
jgi:arginine N-succinyltransferase